MRYLGSKASMAPAIYQILAANHAGPSVCDPFGGLAVVGGYLRGQGCHVVSGDILRFAHLFQVSRLELNEVPDFIKVRRALDLHPSESVLKAVNNGPEVEGWLVTNYADERRFFTRSNALAIERCWHCIEQWDRDGLLSRSERAYLYSALIGSMDKVANTAGTYYAYLKGWHRKALRPFRLEEPVIHSGPEGCAVLCDAEQLVGTSDFDVVYIDPPYNRRSYARYYHLPESIALGRRGPVAGIAGMPLIVNGESQFNRVSKAEDALVRLVARARCTLLVVHYAEGGLLSRATIRRVLTERGSVSEYEFRVRRYTSQKRQSSVDQWIMILHLGSRSDRNRTGVL
jgi:adenine-specific DNA-methyltransferase